MEGRDLLDDAQIVAARRNLAHDGGFLRLDLGDDQWPADEALQAHEGERRRLLGRCRDARRVQQGDLGVGEALLDVFEAAAASQQPVTSASWELGISHVRTCSD